MRYRDLEKIEQDRSTAEANYLRERGWKPDCSLPGAMWLWGKKIDKRYIVLEAKTAIEMQAYIDATKGGGDED